MSASNQHTSTAGLIHGPAQCCSTQDSPGHTGNALQPLNSIGHASFMSPQYVGTASVMPSAVPVISSPNAISDNLWSRTAVFYHDSPCNPPVLDDLGDPRAQLMCRHNLNDHTSNFPLSSESQYAMPDPEPEMFTYNPSSYSSLSQWQDLVIPQPPLNHRQELSSIPIRNRPSSPLVICQWLCNGIRCGDEMTLQEFKRHWQLSHCPERRDARIRCRWQNCDYHKRGDSSTRVMLRSCMWRHVHEVHLGHRRNT